MAKEIKEIVTKEDTFDTLEIRLGRVVSVEKVENTPKPAYKMKVDFGKFGIKSSIGRFTHHKPEEIKDRLVLGVLNFEPRTIGDSISEVLILGVQFPKAESGEATFITPALQAKVGSKLF